MKQVIWILLLTTLTVQTRANVDLDLEFPRAERSHASEFSALELMGVRPPVDLEPGLPGVVSQSPLGACQSFAMAAWLDYIFFFKTGHVVELSEKHLAYELLSFMTDEFWDPVTQSYPGNYLGKPYITAKPELGSGIAPFMLASYFKSATIPNAIYSFGTMDATEGAIGIDVDNYNKYFESNTKSFSRDEYVSALPVAFLSKPPERFVYRLSDTNFSNGSAETMTLNSAKDFSEVLGISNENTVTYYNLEFQGFQMPVPQKEWLDTVNYFGQISDHFGQTNQSVGKNELLGLLKKSLDRRMAVMIAANVWIGDWLSGVVFKGGGGHAMVVVGYQDRDGKTYFKLRNSWGKDRLVKGYDYVEADVLLPNTMYLVIHEP